MAGPLIHPQFVTMVVNPVTLEIAMALGDCRYDPEEPCPSCGYSIDIHETAGNGDLDPQGGCPADEAEARGRWFEWVVL